MTIRSPLVGIALAVIVTACSSEAAPSASRLPEPSERSSVASLPPSAIEESESPRPSPPAPEIEPDEGWIEVASFGSATTIQAVHDVAVAPFGVIAAGIGFPTRNLGTLGPIPGDGRVWLSSDGSRWEDVYPRLVDTGSLVVASMKFSYPCGEGWSETFGSAYVTYDGTTWDSLPFVGDVSAATAADDGTRGTRISGGIDLDSGTLLVGEHEFRATFWFRPSD